MVPPNFLSLSSIEKTAIQQRQALREMFLRTLLRSSDNFLAGYNKKVLIGKGTSTLDKVFFKISCFIQYNATLEKVSM